ncbi:response regulator [Flavitalea flava]
MNNTSQPRLLRNLQIGFGLSLLILIISSVAAYSSIHNLLEGSRWVSHTDSVIIQLESALSTLKDAETGQRGFLLTGDTTFLQPFNGAQDRALTISERVQAMTMDNPVQQVNSADLKRIIGQRLSVLQEIIEQKRSDNIYNLSDLKRGREYMDQARELVQKMQAEEQRLLAQRMARVEKFSEYTPILILVAAFLSILITIFFYRRVFGDYLERAGLYNELEKKDAEISRRIDIIREIADKISEGDYQTRVSDEQKDGLGNLSGSLNKMAESLEDSFLQLSDKEWLQTGIAGLNEEMVGETNMQVLVSDVIAFIAGYSRSQLGALYITDGETLRLHGGYALAAEGRRETLRYGQGLAGQVARDGSTIQVKDIDPAGWVISLASGAILPKTVIAFPFFFEKMVKGVIELGTLESYTDRDLEFFACISENIGMAVNSIETRSRLQELLEETQAQTEELQVQHSEMENLNMELETQAEKLQVSEEELKVQQEELMQTNQELEERSRSLEEKNQLILLRNLDIQKKAEELTVSTKYKSEFMANMSHELRTPLNSILLLSRLLTENSTQNLSTDQVEYARVIQNSGHGLLSLIDEILDLSRIESGKLPLEHSLVRVEGIADDMRSLFQPMAKDKNLELQILTHQGTPVQLETDKMRLEQILKNLLSNAFKFTPKGTITLSISPSPERKNYLDFTVTDSGIGIPENKHQLIFEAFQQADGSTRRKYGGTGLGLSISRELAKLLGGDITLTSVPGEGSQFRLTIPQFKLDPALEEPLASAGFIGGELVQLHGTVQQGLPPSGANHSGWGQETDRPLLTLTQIPADIPDDRNSLVPEDKILLIVEDDPHFARALLDFTRKKGYKGIVSVRGDLALTLAKLYKPLGILLDIQLPVKNGWEVMDELKRDQETRKIPVHIISSFEVKNESLLKGAIDFMRKPVGPEDMDLLFKKIEVALNRGARKVLIVEDNAKHAQALAYFLATHDFRAEVSQSLEKSVESLKGTGVDCVILNMGAPDMKAYETLNSLKQDPALAAIPIIVFTGKNISKGEEGQIKQYADSIVVKTAHSYQRILDEVSLFLHLVDEGKEKKPGNALGKLGGLDEALKNKTVLVADDDVRNIFSLTRALENHKMKVLSAMDGKEALAVIENVAIPVDIILMDMMMPELDGYDTIARIRKDPRFRDLPIIAVTAKAMAGDREKCIQAGASDYISKPVDIDQMISLLRIWLYEK